MTPSISEDLQDIASVDSTVRTGTGAYIPEVPAETVNQEAPKAETPAVETPVAETPVAETPKTEEVKAEAKTEPIIDLAKIFSEASQGKITSAEELSKIIEENSALSEKVKNTPELGEYTLKMDAWMKKGHEPELFHLIHDLPLDDMSAEDKVKANLKIQNPEWSKDDIDLYVKHTYNQLTEEEEGYNVNTVKVGKLKLQQDSLAHETELRKLQEQTFYSDADEKEANRLEGERQSTWKTNLPSIASGITKLPFQLDEKNSFEFAPTAAQVQKAVKAVESAIMNAPVGYDEAGVNSVKELIKNTIINQNINDIIRAATRQASSVVVEQKIKETHNPSGVAPAPAPVISKSIDESNYEKVDSFFFGK